MSFIVSLYIPHTYQRRNVLKGGDVEVAFFPYETDFNDTTESSCHKHISEIGMKFLAVGYVLCMSLE